MSPRTPILPKSSPNTCSFLGQGNNFQRNILSLSSSMDLPKKLITLSSCQPVSVSFREAPSMASPPGHRCGPRRSGPPLVHGLSNLWLIGWSFEQCIQTILYRRESGLHSCEPKVNGSNVPRYSQKTCDQQHSPGNNSQSLS